MHDIAGPYNSYAGYAQPVDHTSHSPSHYYHPYSRGGHTSPRFLQQAQPISPPLSASPPGSLRLPSGVLTSPPTSISPNMVSPVSALDSGFSSDVSPMGHWAYHQPIGTPLTSVTALSGLSPQMSPGLAMVQGYFPQQTSPKGAVTRTRVTRPRAAKTQTSSRTIKKERRSSDDGLSDDEGQNNSGGGGLGFTPAIRESDGLIIFDRPEAIKKARIESEQRRRDELRKGFERVKDVLPKSNQRASKSNILDRAVAHIEQIHASNNYLLAQLEQKEKELASLRAAHQDLASIMARRSDSDSNKSSPQRH
ncbi:hypothetical protein BCR39DRAFT_559530 [Naematelia encephala]|uniref:BHLH domain-containing protein n=1 Tax=Naematelia encephala TaxID=71784 RepID=A0A1Y2B117_9TREE|nr:hypothetical protein BCR39DRAFT_559530 [Naematelia encephala]